MYLNNSDIEEFQDDGMQEEMDGKIETLAMK